jgi:ubiquinone/menaquinone biosynthesis C-methylase UbiE
MAPTERSRSKRAEPTDGTGPSVKERVQRQFSSAAERYATSAVHAGGPDLDALVAAIPDDGRHILDVGCGTGHTTLAVARRADSVVGIDLTEEMLAQARRLATERGIENVHFVQGDAEAIPFADASFDAVVSRYSAHHFPHPERALGEIARVLRPGGTFLVVDTVAAGQPALDTLLNAIEVLRDPSHVRNHTVDDWREMLVQAGFLPQKLQEWEIRLEFNSWLARMQTPDVAAKAITYLLEGAPQEVRDALRVEPDRSFHLSVALFRGVWYQVSGVRTQS